MKKEPNHINQKPPRSAEKLLMWFLKDDLAEEVLGDLDEKFFQTLEKRSIRKARRNYWYQVLHYLRPFAMKFLRYKSSTAMVKHNITVSFRQLMKNKVYSFINIGGLALGMVVAILIGLWVNDELTYNTYHDRYDSIVQLMRNEGTEGEFSTESSMTTGMGTLLATQFGDHFEQVVMVRGRLENRVIANGDKKFTQNGYFMQEGAPDMLGLKMKHGSRAGLSDINSILLSASVSQKLFGDVDPVNQVIKMDAIWDLKVTGVYEDLPQNSQFKDATYISTLNRYLGENGNLTVWNNYNMYVFAELNPQSDLTQVSALIESAFKERLARFGDADEGFFLNPMRDWHLNSAFENGQWVTSKAKLFVWFYTIIGAFILILACINFMNLSTARSEKRAKEVGIRKTLGSIRRQLIGQFYIESFLYCLLAFGGSLLLLQAILPWFNETSGKGIEAPWTEVNFWLVGFGFMCLTAILAGSYPAMYLSSFKPIKALKGTFSAGKGAAMPRKVLVVFQFTISVALIIGTITVNNQINLAKNRPVGYAPEGMISLKPATPDFHEKLPVLVNELTKTGLVEAVGASNYPVTNTLGWNGGFQWEGMQPDMRPHFNAISISHDYGKAVSMKFIAGRDFSREFATDKNGILINRSAMEMMQLEEPVGKTLTLNNRGSSPEHFTILGVVEDMIKGSPFESTSQSIMYLNRREMRWLFIRIAPETSLSEAIPQIRQKFTEIYPAAPFDFQFADQEYATKFEAEQQTSELAGFFCLLAIIISCLGLFGLASYVAEQRSKEIGIRKVLGASLSNLWALLSKDFALLILIACLVAIPVSYAVLDGWLDGYKEFRTPLYWWVFVLAGAGALTVTIITVSFQALKVAVANPVKSLRSE